MKPLKRTTGWRDQAVEWLSRDKQGRVKDSGNVLLTGLLIIAILAVGRITEVAVHSFRLDLITPLSMLQLSLVDWSDVALTTISSVLSFLVATGAAYTLGLIASFLTKSQGSTAKMVGLSISELFRFLYIVPLVLTITLVVTLLLGQNIEGRIPGIGVVAGSLFFSALCIAGYPVFWTVYRGAVRPDRRHELVVDAIYLPPRRLWYLIPVPRHVVVSKRLNDGSIVNLTESIERAWHLTIVAVVIVESVVPGLYQYLSDTFGFFNNTDLKGVGRNVIVAQSILSSTRVFGLMWALFCVDAVGLATISLLLRRRYLRHYGRR